ncbi:hypothetical protein D3C80_1628390 [compost metagenome]
MGIGQLPQFGGLGKELPDALPLGHSPVEGHPGQVAQGVLVGPPERRCLGLLSKPEDQDQRSQRPLHLSLPDRLGQDFKLPVAGSGLRSQRRDRSDFLDLARRPRGEKPP